MRIVALGSSNPPVETLQYLSAASAFSSTDSSPPASEPASPGPARRDSLGGLMQTMMHNIPARGGIDYDESPFLAIWEVTQSCDLACKHCRAAAQPIAHPDQLSTEEGKGLIDQIAQMQVPIFVFTGGDPLKRKDVFELISYAAGKGVQVAVTPSATPLLTREQ